VGVACRTLCPVLDVSPQTFLASYHYLNVDKLANAVPNLDPNSVISLTSVFNVEEVLEMSDGERYRGEMFRSRYRQ